jgi:hypothetical protein
MERRNFVGLLALCTILCCALVTASHAVAAATDASGLLKPDRQSPTDLEVSGLLPGVPDSSHRFITYQDLMTLPQVSATVVSDENFTEMKAPRVEVTGVYLSELSRRIGVSADSDLVDVLCADHYRAPYPANYIAIHRPILVLKIDGQTTSDWARKTGNQDPGPYLITHSNFVPSFHILSHVERPQVPTGVVSIDFTRQKDTFDAIRPVGHFAADSPEMQGFGIAREDCLRCHNSGAVGGTKAGKSWALLSQRAIDDPKSFSNYIQNPKGIDSHSEMPGNPQYDAETIAALTAYFKTFSGK